MLVILFLVLVSASGTSALPDFPDTPAGQAAEAFFGAVEAGDEASFRAFVENHLSAGLRDAHPMDRHLSMLGQMAGELQGATLGAVEEAGPHALHVSLVTTDGQRRTLTFEVEPEPPHGLVGIEAAEASL